ncbi:MAG TPA: ABC transporter family substrate-binding protein [Rugosimonospora sp.]|nr:ABC transporter family substrate-binding protein [Rugosimonospora sp.]
MRRTRQLFAAFVCAVLALAACGSARPAPAQPAAPPAGSTDLNPHPRDALKAGGTLRLAIQQWITQYNVGQVDGTEGDGVSIVELVEPQLWILDAHGSPSLNPDVLVSAKVTATSPHQVVTYQLNPKATWSDGTPVTWQDFATQWRTRNGTNPAYQVSDTAGYDDISDVARGADDRAAVVTFTKPYPDWQGLFDPLLPGSALSTPDAFNKGWIEKVPVWGGPWRIGSMDKSNQTITVVPNEKYWGAKPILSSVVYRALDTAAMTDAYLNNEVDEAPARVPEAYRRLAGAPGTAIRAGGRWDETHVTLGKSGPLADVRVRQAIGLAINRPAVAAAQSAGLPFKVNVLSNHFFMPSQQGYQDTAGQYGQFDPARAGSLLDQAGWARPAGGGTRVKDGKPLRLTYVVSSGSTSDVPQLVQNMLAQVGIQVDLRKVPTNDFFGQYVDRGSFDLVSFRNVDEAFTTRLLAVFRSGGDQNYGKVGSPDIDRVLDEAATQTDRTAAIALYNQADALIWAAGHSVELFQTPEILAVRSGLANVGAYGLAGDRQMVDTGWLK